MPEARLQRCREAYETPWQTAIRTVMDMREAETRAAIKRYDQLFEEWQNRSSNTKPASQP